MNSWCWIGVIATGLLIMYGCYVWGFMHGSEDAAERITCEIMNWTDVMERKYCESIEEDGKAL